MNKLAVVLIFGCCLVVNVTAQTKTRQCRGNVAGLFRIDLLRSPSKHVIIWLQIFPIRNDPQTPLEGNFLGIPFECQNRSCSDSIRSRSLLLWTKRRSMHVTKSTLLTSCGLIFALHCVSFTLRKVKLENSNVLCFKRGISEIINWKVAEASKFFFRIHELASERIKVKT